MCRHLLGRCTRKRWLCHLTESTSASFLGEGLQLTGHADLSSQQTQLLSSSHTCGLPRSDSLDSKTFYKCKQIIHARLVSPLAGLEIKSGSPKWHGEESRERAGRWSCHYICYFVRQFALKKGIQLLCGLDLQRGFSPNKNVICDTLSDVWQRNKTYWRHWLKQDDRYSNRMTKTFSFVFA